MKKNIFKLIFSFICLFLFAFSFSSCDLTNSDNNYKIYFIVENTTKAVVSTNGNEVIKLPKEPTKEGYNFDGWYYDNNVWSKQFTNKSLIENPISSDLKVYARFVNSHEHTYSESWQYDEFFHWHPATCEHSSLYIGKDQHVEGDWIVDKEPTYYEEGSKHKTCSICGGTTKIVAIPVLFSGDIEFKSIELDKYNHGSVTVANAIETFDFVSEILLSGDVTFGVFSDVECENKVSSNETPLQIGNNTFYVAEIIDGSIIGIYTITIRRRPLYNVSFDSNGGSLVDSQEVEEGSYITTPENPTKLGYDFDKWDSKISEVVTKDTIVTASWTPKTDIAYKTEYYIQNANDDEYTLYDSTDSKGKTDTFALASIMSINHFSVVDDNVKGIISGDGSLVLKVYYNRDIHTINLIGSDENFGNYSDVSGSYRYQQEITLEATPAIGYSFAGWYIGEKLISEESSYKYVVLKDETIEAKWSANKDTKYTINYYLENVDDDDFTLIDSITLEGTTNTVVEANINSYEHFSVVNDKVSGTIVADESLLLKVYYSRNKYSLSLYNENIKAGSFIDLSDSYKYNEEITIKANNNDGYSFEGWYNSTELLEKNDTYTFNMLKDTKINAKWSANTYNVSFDCNGGTEIAKKEVTFDSEFTLPTDSTLKGYNFDGWYYGNTKIENGTWKISNDITLKAKWVTVNYTITYELNRGTNNANNLSSYTITSEDIVFLAPTNNNTDYTYEKIYSYSDGDISYKRNETTYTFDGWYKESDFKTKIEKIAKGSIGDIKIYAKWTSNTSYKYWSDPYLKADNNIYFGSYPQYDATTENAHNITTYCSELPTAQDNKGWFCDNIKQEGTIWYKDLIIGSRKYRAVYFTQYRSSLMTKADYSYMYISYNTGKVYLFEYTPIQWIILDNDGSNVTMYAHVQLDAQNFYSGTEERTEDNKTVYANNYEYSLIRKWLNETFYNTAFNDSQKELINEVMIDNNPNMKDKVWLLSTSDISKMTYNSVDKSRYSVVQGVHHTSYGGFMLRDASSENHTDVLCINDSFQVVSYSAEKTEFGIVPVVQIKLK